MRLTLKSKDADCYTSNRVFDGVRVKDADAATQHVARLKRIVGSRAAKDKPVSADRDK